MVGSLVIVFLQIFSWFWQWNNFENRLIFGKVKLSLVKAVFFYAGSKAWNSLPHAIQEITDYHFQALDSLNLNLNTLQNTHIGHNGRPSAAEFRRSRRRQETCHAAAINQSIFAAKRWQTWIGMHQNFDVARCKTSMYGVRALMCCNYIIILT